MIPIHAGPRTLERKLIKNCVVLIFALFVLSAMGCGRSSSLRWTEDVLLPDGRIVTLTRYQEFKGPYEIGSTPTESDYWFEFKHPDTGEIVRWAYNRDLATVALMIAKKAPYLLVKPRFGSSEFEFDCPNPPYLLFRYSSKSWERIALTQIPVKRLRSNMTYSPKSKRPEIERNSNHRSVEQTQNSIISTQKPWFMDFTDLKTQSFETANCYGEPDYLLTSPSSSQRQQ